MNQEKKVITCDIDGVLTDYPSCWLQFLKEKCGVLYKSTSEAKKNEKDYFLYKDIYRESEYKATLPINILNRDSLIALSKKYDIVFTTSRPIYEKKYPKLLSNTYDWLKNNGLIFKELRYKDINANFLLDLDIAFHIDDDIEYACSVLNKLKEKYPNDVRKVYLVSLLDFKVPIDDNIIYIRSLKEINNE